MRTKLSFTVSVKVTKTDYSNGSAPHAYLIKALKDTDLPASNKCGPTCSGATWFGEPYFETINHNQRFTYRIRLSISEFLAIESRDLQLHE